MCKGSLVFGAKTIECVSCKKDFSYIFGIPSFVYEEECKKWQDYHDKTYGSQPLPPHPFYEKYSREWNVILDIGCGDGCISALAAKGGKTVFCVDPSKDSIGLLIERRCENQIPVHATGERLPFRDQSFDGIYNVFLIEHLADPVPLLKELKRVLKPDGEMAVATDTLWYYRYTRILQEWKRKGWKNWRPDDPTHFNLMVPARLRAYLANAGFKIKKEDINWLFENRINYGSKAFNIRFVRRLAEDFLTSSFVFIAQHSS